MSQQRPAETNWEQIALDRWEELERLRAVNRLNAGCYEENQSMKTEIDELRAALNDTTPWTEEHPASFLANENQNLRAEVERLRAELAQRNRQFESCHLRMSRVEMAKAPYRTKVCACVYEGEEGNEYVLSPCAMHKEVADGILKEELAKAKEVRDEHVDLNRQLREDLIAAEKRIEDARRIFEHEGLHIECWSRHVEDALKKWLEGKP